MDRNPTAVESSVSYNYCIAFGPNGTSKKLGDGNYWKDKEHK